MGWDETGMCVPASVCVYVCVLSARTYFEYPEHLTTVAPSTLQQIFRKHYSS